MPVHSATHPVVAHKMTRLRDVRTNGTDFRRLLKELTFYLGYEATRDSKLVPDVVTTPMNISHNGSKIGGKVAIVPILRAGLAMTDAMLELIPSASVHHIGMYRSKDSLLPIQYYNKLPKNQVCDVAYVVDPCIATSGTIEAVVSILKRWGAKRIVVVSILSSRLGVDTLLKLHPDIELFVGEIDEVLSPTGMILPGLGDAGDRQFSTPSDEVPDLEGSPTKRKKDEL